MDHLSANSLPVQSPPAINTALVSETDGASVTGTETGGVNTPVGLSPTSTSATKQKYAGKTPGEIVTGAMKNRRPVGGLKKVMSMYHDNRRHMTPVVGGAGRRSSEEVRGASVDDRFMRDSDRLHLVEADYSEQTSYSASELEGGGNGRGPLCVGCTPRARLLSNLATELCIALKSRLIS